jgi:hypothetical protein
MEQAQRSAARRIQQDIDRHNRQFERNFQQALNSAERDIRRQIRGY